MIRRSGWITCWTLTFLLFLVSTEYGQRTPEVYRTAQGKAVAAMKERDFGSAIKLYAEAIDLVPKLDEFTPKIKTAESSEGNLAPGEYRGLDTLYLGRFWAYLGKNETELAQADLNRSLIVLNLELGRDFEKAKSLRSAVKIEIEKKIENPNSHNSDLIKAGFLFNGIKWSCSRIYSRYTYSPKIDFGPTIPQRFLSNESVLKLLAEIGKHCEAAQFGEAEAFVSSMIDLQNRSHNFVGLKLANELVAGFPKKIESYQVRAKVNRFLGNEQQASFDEQKVRELRDRK